LRATREVFPQESVEITGGLGKKVGSAEIAALWIIPHDVAPVAEIRGIQSQ
jgi:hypothetical protein